MILLYIFHISKNCFLMSGPINKEIITANTILLPLHNNLHASFHAEHSHHEGQLRILVVRQVQSGDVVNHQQITILIVEQVVLPEVVKVYMSHITCNLRAKVVKKSQFQCSFSLFLRKNFHKVENSPLCLEFGTPKVQDRESHRTWR